MTRIEANDDQAIIQTIPIDEIYPDIKQPRRAIPLSISRDWNGSPDLIPTILQSWDIRVGYVLKMVAGYRTSSWETYSTNILENVSELTDIPNEVEEFVDLVSLASSIAQDGLANPITVHQSDSGFKVETGERRLLAYHMLRAFYGDRYAYIPARVIATPDVWRQAAENGARRPLNAISMARQIALLVMDMYQHIGFESYDSLVMPGGCDRPFYAQVSNGNVFRIKPGMLSRILEVTGLKSQQQLSQYRALLNIDDHLWTLTDTENWPEYRIRQEIASRRLEEEQNQQEQDDPLLEPPNERQHSQIQWLLAQLGQRFGYKVWIARNDRKSTWNGEALGNYSIDELPYFNGIGPKSQQMIELIDVVWLKGKTIVAAFEVEGSTSIYSGLLRMSDLAIALENTFFPFYVVVPERREHEVEAQLSRLTFQKLRLHERCSYVTFEALITHAESMMTFATSVRAIDKIARTVEAIDLDDE